MEPTPNDYYNQNIELAPNGLKAQILQSLQKPFIQYLLIFLVVLFTYLPSLWYTFVWDDFTAITSNTSIREWGNIPKFFVDPYTFGHDPKRENAPEWRPLRNIYYLFTYKTHGLHPAGWHLHHIILLSIVSSLLLTTFHRLIRFHLRVNPNDYLPLSLQMATWLAVLAWAVHPANTEVTVWLKSADDLLSVLFFLGALIVLFPVDSQLTIKRTFVAAGFFSLALMAKASVAPLPAIYVVLALVLAPRRKETALSRPFLTATILLFTTLVIYMKIRVTVLGKLEQVDYLTGDFTSMMATMTTAAVRYLQLTFWPFWPTVQIGDYVGWPSADSWADMRVLRSSAILSMTFIIGIITSWRRPVVLAGLLFMLLAYATVANVIPMMQIMAERFMFLPLIGVALSAAWFFHLWLHPNPLKRLWLPVGIAIALLITTQVRMPRFIDNANFQAEAAKALPTSARALYNHGIELYLDGQTTSAISYLSKSMETYPTVFTGMATALALLDIKETTRALTYADNMIRDFPKEPRPLALKADLLRIRGQHDLAIDHYTSALLWEKEAPNLYYFRALSLVADNRTTEAIEDLGKVLVYQKENTSATELLEKLTSTSAFTEPPAITGKVLPERL